MFSNDNIDERNLNNVKITIFGIGGGGCNAVNRLVQRKEFEGVHFIAANTDKMALENVVKDGVLKIHIGQQLTQGMGAGSDEQVGANAANESAKEIEEALEGTKLLFITAGMGGGTGTGGAPVVASIAKKKGILTIGVVTKPFRWEGPHKMEVANSGISKLYGQVDVLVVIPNERAFTSQNADANMYDVFQVADNVLKNSIWGVVNIVGQHSLINTDFADIRTVLSRKGYAHIGIGQASGDNRVIEALRQACKDQLMETTIAGAKNIIINAVADQEIPAGKIIEAFNMIPEVVAKDANIITGFGFHKEPDLVMITIIATDFASSGDNKDQPGVNTKEYAEQTLQVNDNKAKEVKKDEYNSDDVPQYLRYMNDRQ